MHTVSNTSYKRVVPVLQCQNLLKNLLLPLLLLLSSGILLAQNSDDGAGKFASSDGNVTVGGRYQSDISLQVNGYLWAPLFNIDPASGVRSTNLGPGGGADLAVAYYLTTNLGIGGFLDLGISSPANQVNVQNFLLIVMLGPRISYDINIYTIRFTSHPLFTIPLGFGLGVSAAKFGDITNVIPVLKFDAGFYINPFDQPEWSLGLSLHYWFATEFSKTELSRIGNYLMIGIGFNFHSGL